MITIHVSDHDKKEYWDPKKEEFITIPACRACDLKLEHSLIAISKWESEYHVPFISTEQKTPEQTLFYIKCMTINSGVPDNVYMNLNSDDIKSISDYINNPMTATTVSKIKEKRGSRQIVTNEVLYSWLVGLQIPWEVEKWHLNRLVTLIEVCDANNTPPKKMTKDEIIARNSELNRARRAKYNTKG